jgi:hypothetical protein
MFRKFLRSCVHMFVHVWCIRWILHHQLVLFVCNNLTMSDDDWSVQSESAATLQLVYFWTPLCNFDWGPKSRLSSPLCLDSDRHDWLITIQVVSLAYMLNVHVEYLFSIASKLSHVRTFSILWLLNKNRETLPKRGSVGLWTKKTTSSPFPKF